MTAEAPNIRLTTHAKRRFKERVGRPIRAAQRAAEHAFVFGLTVDELPYFQRERLAEMAERHHPDGGSIVRVHEGVAWVFTHWDDEPETGAYYVAVTVLPGYRQPPNNTPKRRRPRATAEART